MPSGSTWQTNYGTVTTERLILSDTTLWLSNPQNQTPYLHEQGQSTLQEPIGVPDGTDVAIRTNLIQPGGVTVDTGTLTTPWSNTAGLAPMVNELSSGQGQGGFTDSDRALQQQIAKFTIPDTFLTQLVTEEISPGITDQPVTAALVAHVFAVIVRVQQIPPDTLLGTADLDYSMRGFAVARFFRGSDILWRVPIHRSSQYISLQGTGATIQLMSALTEIWAPGLSVEVVWAPGAAGQVFLMHTP